MLGGSGGRPPAALSRSYADNFGLGCPVGGLSRCARVARAMDRCRSHPAVSFGECRKADHDAGPDDPECPAGDHVTGVVRTEVYAGEPDAGNDGYRGRPRERFGHLRTG